MSTNDWITLGVLDLKTLSTTSCRIYWSGFYRSLSKLRIDKFPTYIEAPSKDLSAGILSKECTAAMISFWYYFCMIFFGHSLIMDFRQIVVAIWICIY